MAKPFRRVEAVVPRRSRGYGAKAENLAELARAGFPVPAGFALPSRVADGVFDRLLPPEDKPAALLARAAKVDGAELQRIARRVREAPLPTDIRDALVDVRNTLFEEGARALAVRSSSNREDLDLTSAAGLHETVLNVVDDVGLFDAVRVCWASLFRPEVFAYFAALGGGPAEDPSVGVLIQAMVPATESGVLFTANPLTGDVGEMVVNAIHGLGAPLSEGRISPDTYRLDRATGALRDRVIGDKQLRAVAREDGLVVEEPVPDALRREPVLGEAALAELRRVGERLEEHFGVPQDVEWARVDGVLYLLQSRPVTGLSAVARRRPRRRGAPMARARIVWSNANVGEALPGVATPLTWSVLSGFADLGFRRAFGALGCQVPRDAELVGSFRGRIYLNLSEFTRIAGQVPFLRPTTLLSLGGGGYADLLELDLEQVGHAGFFARLPLTIARLLRENVGVAERVEDFERTFADERERWRALELPVLSPSALDRTLADLEQLLDDAGAVMLTCYGNLLLLVVLLRAALRLVAGEGYQTLERGVLTGLEDVESAAPGLALWHVAEVASSEPAVRDLLLATPAEQLSVEALPPGATREAFERLLRAYGYRGPREAELSAPRWSEDATVLFIALQKHLRGELRRPVDVERRQREARQESMAALERVVPLPGRRAMRRLLAEAQRFTRLRERLRARVTEVLGRFRELALDTSRRIDLREPGTGRDAAFFLTLDELHGFLRGDLRTVGPLVRQRRTQHARDVALPDPPDTFVGYPPPVDQPPPADDGGALVGLPASSGNVTGRARVLTGPGDAAGFEAGEVLVAPYADVGWSPLFPTALALVTDLGGPLSHAAVIAREYGVPAVVNLKNATRRVRTGDVVRVDGDAGTLEVLERAATDSDAAP